MVRDSSGRRMAHIRSSTGKKITLNDRDLMWLAKLARHGPLPTSYLLAFSAGLRESQKREKERLGDLFHENNTPYNAAYIDRPAQQFATMKAGYNQIVHAISKAGRKALHVAGLEEPHLTHQGPWVHRLMVACSTASIELATLKRQDITFIPQSAILARAKAELRCPVTIETAPGVSRTKDLVPDAVFGLQYHTSAGDRFRFFVLEVIIR